MGKSRDCLMPSMAMAMIGLTLVVFLAHVHGANGTRWGEGRAQAPAFTLPSLQGQSISLDEFSGQVILLNFWATWCKDCAKEMPEFEKLYQAYEGKGLSVVAIALDKEGQPAIEAFLKRENLNLTYPILLDSDNRVARAYQLAWVPVTIVVGRDGKILETVLGARPWGSEEIMNSFEQLLKTCEHC